MRFLVCSGTDRDAGELFRTCETVLGVSLTRSATALSVAAGFLVLWMFSFLSFIRGWSSLGSAPELRTVPHLLPCMARDYISARRQRGEETDGSFKISFRTSMFFS